jgi:hypothetical protein
MRLSRAVRASTRGQSDFALWRPFALIGSEIVARQVREFLPPFEAIVRGAVVIGLIGIIVAYLYHNGND